MIARIPTPPPVDDASMPSDRRPLALHRRQPAEVVTGQSQPLNVQHVRVAPRDLLLQAPGAGHVLEPLRQEPQPRTRVAAQQTAAVPEEDVVLAIAVRRRQVRERETRRVQVDLVPAPRQSLCEAAIVGEGVADWIG